MESLLALIGMAIVLFASTQAALLESRAKDGKASRSTSQPGGKKR